MDLASTRSNNIAEDVSRFTDPLTGLGNRRRLIDKILRLVDERALDPAPFTVGIYEHRWL